MERLIYIFLIAFATCIFTSCSDDDLDKNSIYDTTSPERTVFDKWLLNNYTYPYNIDFKYKMADIETDQSYELTPASLEMSKKMAKLVKHLWLETYDEVAGQTFTKTYIPKTILLIGSGGYKSNGQVVLGTAEGGLKVTLYYINTLDDIMVSTESLNYFYFHTMHHEFAHILHQTKNYDPEFKQISASDYVGGDWSNDVFSNESLSLGFITPYSRESNDEDFVEIYSTYITHTQEWWDQQLVKAGDSGKAILDKKLDIVKDYMLSVWNIDMDILRDVVQRRTDEAVNSLDLEIK